MRTNGVSPITALDQWAGKTLFLPAIIRWCQMVGMTQYAVYRYCWIIAIFVAIYSWRLGHWWIEWVWFSICLLFGLALVLECAVSQDEPIRHDHPLLRRYMLVVVIAKDLIPGVVVLIQTVDPRSLLNSSVAFGLLVLTAEYALMIKNIPDSAKKFRLAIGRI